MKTVPYPEIPFSEYQQRISKLTALLKKHKLDGACFFSPLNLRYYFGYRKASYGSSAWWRRGAIVNSDGKVDVLDLQIINNVVLGLRSCS